VYLFWRLLRNFLLFLSNDRTSSTITDEEIFSRWPLFYQSNANCSKVSDLHDNWTLLLQRRLTWFLDWTMNGQIDWHIRWLVKFYFVMNDETEKSQQSKRSVCISCSRVESTWWWSSRECRELLLFILLFVPAMYVILHCLPLVLMVLYIV
jgi:hypothetical protein